MGEIRDGGATEAAMVAYYTYCDSTRTHRATLSRARHVVLQAYRSRTTNNNVSAMVGRSERHAALGHRGR